MKTMGTLAAVVLGVALQVVAAPQAEKPPTPITTKQKNVQSVQSVHLNVHLSVVNALTQNGIKKKTKIERAGNMSSRSWTQTVGWHPGRSQFPSVDTHESKLVVLWVGYEPWR